MNSLGRMNHPCAYCGERAVHRDHVVPKSLRKSHVIPRELSMKVPACFACNIRKGSRRLVPPSLAHLIPALTEAFPGTVWRVWDGSTSSPSYREVHA